MDTQDLLIRVGKKSDELSIDEFKKFSPSLYLFVMDKRGEYEEIIKYMEECK